MAGDPAQNATGGPRIDAVRVGDVPELPLGSVDPAILLWAEQERRIVITADKSTMVRHLEEHLETGRHLPGIFMILPGAALHEIFEFIALVAQVGEQAEWRDRIEYLR